MRRPRACVQRSLYCSLDVTSVAVPLCTPGGSHTKLVGTADCSTRVVERSCTPPCTDERARSYSTMWRSSAVEKSRGCAHHSGACGAARV
eukprot:6158289-Prymnesium_polylepis.1